MKVVGVQSRMSKKSNTLKLLNAAWRGRRRRAPKWSS